MLLLLPYIPCTDPSLSLRPRSRPAAPRPAMRGIGRRPSAPAHQADTALDLALFTEDELAALFTHNVGEKIRALSYKDGNVYRGRVCLNERGVDFVFRNVLGSCACFLFDGALFQPCWSC